MMDLAEMTGANASRAPRRRNVCTNGVIASQSLDRQEDAPERGRPVRGRGTARTYPKVSAGGASAFDWLTVRAKKNPRLGRRGLGGRWVELRRYGRVGSPHHSAHRDNYPEWGDSGGDKPHRRGMAIRGSLIRVVGFPRIRMTCAIRIRGIDVAWLGAAPEPLLFQPRLPDASPEGDG